MLTDVCNFEALAGPEIQKQLEEEFQYQMDLTDGEYVFWDQQSFKGHHLVPAKDAVSQAILQYFANRGCPISIIRLGCSLSHRNYEHGPIVSDDAAFRYLLQGLEQVSNSLYDHKISDLMKIYTHSQEFRAACELLISYEKQLMQKNLCNEIKEMILEHIIKRKDRTQ